MSVENACIDLPSSADWLASEIFWSIDVVPFPINEHIIIEDQSLEDRLKMSCTRQSPGNAIKALWNPNYSNAAAWKRYVDVVASAILKWASIQSGMDQAIKEGFLAGRVRCDTLAQMDTCLEKWRPICTGSLDGDWWYVKKYHVYRQRTDGKEQGHAFCIFKKRDPETYLAWNSFGPDNGVFEVPASLVMTLYSRNAVMPIKTAAEIAKEQKEKRDNIELAIATAFVFNGLDLDAPAKRGQVGLMFGRLIISLWKSEAIKIENPELLKLLKQLEELN